MALEQDTSRAQCLTPRQKYFPARADVVFYKGAIVCKRKGSKLVEIPDPLAPRTDLLPLGVCMYPVDTTDLADGELSVCIEAGAYRDFSTGTSGNEVTADMVGETVYMFDDDTLYATDDGGTISPGGELVFVDSNEHDGSTQLAVYFDWERVELLEAIAALQESAASASAALTTLAALNIQAGTATLVAGVALLVPATITATSRVVVTMTDPGAGAITGFAGFKVTNQVVGAPGSFDITAIDDAKATIITAVCVVAWHVIDG